MSLNPIPVSPIAIIGGLHAGEVAIILGLVFLLFGAKKIPELMRSLGRAQGEYQHARKQFEKEIREVESGAPAKATAAAASPTSSTTYVPENDLDAAQAKAKGLGIETSGKSLEELNKEIAEKTGGPTA